ncbi:MAG: ribonuclease D [Planctomycetes bacterium]|nr:ribonuclease D [Planctomycetota bacterium]
MSPPETVCDQQHLETCCRKWRAAGRLAFDTEFIRDETYEAALCLIQVSIGDGEVVLIDPTCDLDVAPFWDLIADPQVTAIVHAGKEDFELCLRTTGRLPRNVFDVQIGAGFVGYGYPLSLARLVDQVLHRRIAKGQTMTDWLRRPLTEQQIRYAVEDVTHLPDVYSKLVAQLEEAGRLAWAQEEFRRFEEAGFYRPRIPERLFKLRGSKRLDGLGLAALERLIEWRDHWAQERNRPIRAMMRDDVLVEIARRRPAHASDLQVLRGFPQARNRKVVDELLALIKDASATPRREWPKPYQPREDTPMIKATLDILSAVTRAICYEEGLGHELVGNSQRLREFVDFHVGRESERPSLMLGWRAEFIGQRLENLLSGRSELHLFGWPDDPRLDVVTHAATPTD